MDKKETKDALIELVYCDSFPTFQLKGLFYYFIYTHKYQHKQDNATQSNERDQTNAKKRK